MKMVGFPNLENYDQENPKKSQYDHGVFVFLRCIA
jgi:hypothetical protein